MRAIRLKNRDKVVLRYIMCGRGVPLEIMERIDAAILRLHRGR
ncbi:hypothetical protein [Fundidesulfovibrio soli]|nr:hypothetical protein [Fundidesulfovibrio soli]